MISKLRFSLITVIMLVLLGFGFQNQAIGQPDRGVICPDVPYTTGYTDLEIRDPFNPLVFPADFTAGIIGTIEGNGVDLVAGWDWMHVDKDFFFESELGWGKGRGKRFPTNLTGSQIIVPWNQDNGRNTYVQLTNSGDKVINDDFNPPIEVPVRKCFCHCLDSTVL